MEQGSQEWIKARLGKVTASRIADVMAKTKAGPSAMRSGYMADLLVERLTGEQAERFINEAMRHGTATEPMARTAYQFKTDAFVDEVGFIDHPSLKNSGASPDGIIGEDGLIEIKCPNTKTHLETIQSRTVPGKYVLQMQWQMACTDRQWCDFVSFDPRLPDHLQLFIQRVPRDDAKIKEIEAAVGEFLSELDAMEADLSAVAYGRAA